MTSFKKTHTRAYSKSGAKVTSDTTYWKKLEFPVTIKEFTAIDFVDACPTDPHYIAVTSGPKINLYHQQTTQVWRTLTRFQRLAYGGKFKHDGQLLMAGSEEGQVRLFNYKQKELLRIFKGHTGPTHRVDFIQGRPQVVSFSDDKTAALWDVSGETQICTLTGHEDFIRAGMASPASDSIILSGSYDHTVKLWDTRTGSSVLTVDHGAPVESIVCFPSGGIFVSAGGTEVRVWDVISGRLLSKLSQHHKTITCLGFASDKKRLLSGSLDRHIKIYDVNTYNVVHTLDFPAPILSLAVTPQDSTLAVGMISSGSGLLSIQHRRESDESTTAQTLKKRADIRNAVSEDFRVMPEDVVVQHITALKMASYDTRLRKFQYSKALDEALIPYVMNKTPSRTVGLLQELIRRRGLRTAVAGRDTKRLAPLLKFLIKNIRQPLFKQVLMDVTNVVLDIYGDTLDENPALISYFTRLKKEMETELLLSREHMSLMGAIQMFLAASNHERIHGSVSASSTTGTDANGSLYPSSAAETEHAVVVEVS